MRNDRKKIKGFIARRHSEQAEDYERVPLTSPYLRALENPDVLSDESALFPERDFDEEEAREIHLENFKVALAKLTPKQRAIVEVMARVQDQQLAADEIGIARSTLAVTLMKIEKKIEKLINKMPNRQC